jgi:hypothetical protein
MMADLLAHFANFPALGEEMRQHGSRRIRTAIPLALDGFALEIQQDPGLVLATNPSGLAGQWKHTTNVLVRDVKKAQVSEVRELLGDLRVLLMLGSLSQVHFYGFDYPAGSQYGEEWASGGETNTDWPLISSLAGASVGGFITDTWPRYRSLKNSRRLPVVMYYLTEAQRRNLPLELRLVTLFLVLECLKDSYARQQGIPFSNGRFRKPQGIRPIARCPPWSFADLLRAMLAAEKTRRGIKRIVDLRNQLIHSGISRWPRRTQLRVHRSTMVVIEEYLLRLLRYRGVFNAYGAGVRHI